MLLDTRSTPPTPPTPSPIDSQENEDLVDPVTGEVIDRESFDALISAWETAHKLGNAIYDFRSRIAKHLWSKTEAGDTKTRRVRGDKRIAKLDPPGDYWDQSILKEVWNSYPAHSKTLLRIERLAPQLREVKKLMGTTGPEDIEQVKRMLKTANRGPSGNPTVTVEV